MKKTTILYLLIVLVAGILVSCRPFQVTKGSAAVSDVDKGSCGWVQLWEGGPKWAEFNVGATISDYSTVIATTDSEKYTTANTGGYYQWGGTTDKNTCVKIGETCPDVITGDISGTGTPGESTLGDTARLLWGANWKMPTQADLCALANKQSDGTTPLTTDLTIWEYCDGSTKQYVSGCTLAGYKVSGVGNYSNNCIFLPFAGYFLPENEKLENLGSEGSFWSSTIVTKDGKYLYSDVSEKKVDGAGASLGLSVRAILAE